MTDADSLNVLLYYALSACCLPFIALFVFVIMKRSPSCMIIYRNTLLNMMIWYALSIASFGVLQQPVTGLLGTMPCVKLYGAGVMLFGTAGGYVACFSGAISVLNTGTAIVLCFFYRYIALGRPHLSIHSNSLHAFLVGLLAHTVTTALVLCILAIFMSVVQITHVDQVYYLCVPPAYNSYTSLFCCFTATFMLIGCVAALTLTVLSIRVLLKRKSQMVAKTYRLQSILTLNLVLLGALPTLLDAIPVTVVAVALLFQPDCLYMASSVALHLPFFDIPLVCLVTIGFVTPYRKAVFALFRRKKTSSGNSFGALFTE